MTDEQVGHIKRFVNNPPMADAVYLAVREAFLKPRGKREVLAMAAERLAVELLGDAMRDLDQYKEIRQEPKVTENRGL